MQNYNTSNCRFLQKNKILKKKKEKELQLTLLTINEKRQCDEIDKSLNETNNYYSIFQTKIIILKFNLINILS